MVDHRGRHAHTHCVECGWVIAVDEAQVHCICGEFYHVACFLELEEDHRARGDAS